MTEHAILPAVRDALQRQVHVKSVWNGLAELYSAYQRHYIAHVNADIALAECPYSDFATTTGAVACVRLVKA